MNQTKLKLAGLLAGSLFIGAISLGATSNEAAIWKGEMRNLSHTLTKLFPYLMNDKSFEKNVSTVKELSKEIERLSKSFAGKKNDSSIKKFNSPDSDLSVPFIASLFEEDVKRANMALKQGHYRYARTVLGKVTQYCISCHTRTNSRNAFPTADVKQLGDSVPLVERAKFLAATRQFDLALEMINKAVERPSLAAEHPLDWERSIRLGLAIAVRVKRDPVAAMKLVDIVNQTPNSAQFMRFYAKQWKRAINDWRKEINRKLKTPGGKLIEAKRLMNAGYASQSYPADQSGLIQYLRASSIAHDLLNQSPKGQTLGEALYISGLIYDTLGELSPWSLHEIYFENCIRKVPHSSIAQKCFQQLEFNTHRDFTGSGGTFIPEDVKTKLKELKKIALPKA